MDFFKRIYFGYILKRYPIRHHAWASAIGQIPLLRDIGLQENVRLRELSTLFLHKKQFTGIGMKVTEEMRIIIAAQACLPVLVLGIELLDGWTEIVIYPDAFRVSRDEQDENGIVHHNERILSGEAWSRGPLVFSWHDIQKDIHDSDEGHNVIIHEIAHKLDMLNGRANGMPALHISMNTGQWTAAFSAAYQSLNKRLEHHHRPCVNPYAATSPAEFFAVFSEYFFSAPEILQQHFPKVFEQLKFYYRQDPLRNFQVINN